jgi:hypothetical protein
MAQLRLKAIGKYQKTYSSGNKPRLAGTAEFIVQIDLLSSHCD